jgi:hypothetical protein
VDPHKSLASPRWHISASLPEADPCASHDTSHDTATPCRMAHFTIVFTCRFTTGGRSTHVHDFPIGSMSLHHRRCLHTLPLLHRRHKLCRVYLPFSLLLLYSHLLYLETGHYSERQRGHEGKDYTSKHGTAKVICASLHRHIHIGSGYSPRGRGRARRIQCPRPVLCMEGSR